MVQRKTAVNMYSTPSNKSSDNTALLLDFVVDIDSNKNRAELQFWNKLKSMTITNISVLYLWVSTSLLSITLPPLTWASYQIRKIVDCACAGNAGNVFPCRRLERKQLTAGITARAVMHVGIAYPRWRGKRSRIPGARAPAILRTYLARCPLRDKPVTYCRHLAHPLCWS